MEGCNLNPTYTLGIDFGTLSARSVLVDIQTGEERISCVYEYPDGVIDKTLPGSCIPLPRDFSLQNPADYQTALEYLLTETWRQGGITPDAVHAIGVDFTACTMLPVDRTMTPLCFDPAYRENPHSWAKLWKHHGAQEEAQIIAETVRRRGETFLRRYGNQSSSEWYVAKLLEVYRKSPDIYHAASQFINASDWVTYLMTGVCASSYCTAGFKCFWSPREGYPNWDFLNPWLRALAMPWQKK